MKVQKSKISQNSNNASVKAIQSSDEQKMNHIFVTVILSFTRHNILFDRSVTVDTNKVFLKKVSQNVTMFNS